MFREEFRLKHFKLWHPVRRNFTDSKWLPLPAFIVFRLVVLVYILAWLIYNINRRGVLFIYLTNWTFILLNVYFIVATTLSCIALYKDMKKQRGQRHEDLPLVEIAVETGDELDESTESARENDALRWQHKLQWLLYTISSTGGLFVTVGYWTVLVDNEIIDANNITKHLLNSVFMLTDTCLSCIPVLLVHCLFALLYFIVYILLSVIYWLLGGTNVEEEPYIYRSLDYNDFAPKTGGFLVVFLLLVLPLLHLFFFGLTKLRDYLYEKFQSY